MYGNEWSLSEVGLSNVAIFVIDRTLRFASLLAPKDANAAASDCQTSAILRRGLD